MNSTATTENVASITSARDRRGSNARIAYDYGRAAAENGTVSLPQKDAEFVAYFTDPERGIPMIESIQLTTIWGLGYAGKPLPRRYR